MLERETVDVAAGEVPREGWYLLTSMSSQQCGPVDLLRLIRNHWSIENSLHHVKDRSLDEDIHTLRLEGWFPATLSMPLRGKNCALRPLDTIAWLCGRALWLCNRPGASAGYNTPA